MSLRVKQVGQRAHKLQAAGMTPGVTRLLKTGQACTQWEDSMRCLSHRLSCGVLAPLCLVVGSTGAAIAALDRYAGSFSASGTVMEGPAATSHQVTRRFTTSQRGTTGFSLQGTCQAYLVLSRSISADLVVDPRSGKVTGTYTGSRVGTAQLTGRQEGAGFDLVIEWPKPLYGDTTANMRIVSLDPDRFRIVVTDRIGVGGPVRPTTDLTLARQ
jgi:hypothetical protein